MPLGKLGMPRFYLHVRVGDRRIEDPEGVDAPDIDATLVEVVSATQELMSEELLNREPAADDRFEIEDCSGTLLATVPLTRELASGAVDLQRTIGFSYKRH